MDGFLSTSKTASGKNSARILLCHLNQHLPQAIIFVPVVQVELNPVTVFVYPHGRKLIAADHAPALVAKCYAFDAHIDLRSVLHYTDSDPHLSAKFSPEPQIQNESKLRGPASCMA